MSASPGIQGKVTSVVRWTVTTFLLGMLVILLNIVWSEGKWTDPTLFAAGALTVGGVLTVAFFSDTYALGVGFVAAICAAFAVRVDSPVLGWVTLGLLTVGELIGKYRESRSPGGPAAPSATAAPSGPATASTTTAT